MTEQIDDAAVPEGEPAPKEVRVVRSTRCPSVSGQSTIGYDFGECEGNPMFRVTFNSGGGMYGKDWVPMKDVLDVLKDPANADTIAARAFRLVFLGKSINTQSFLLAALRNEGVVIVHPDKPRAYKVSELQVFEERMNALGSASTSAEGVVGESPAKPDKRPVLKLKKKGAPITPVVRE